MLFLWQCFFQENGNRVISDRQVNIVPLMLVLHCFQLLLWYRQQLGPENPRNISRFLLFKSCCNWWQVHFYPHPAFSRLLGIYGIYSFYVPADRMWRLIDQNRASLICCSPENSYWLNKANLKVVHWPWFCFQALNATTKLFFQLPCNIQQYKVQMWAGNVYYGWKYTLGRCCWIVQSLLWTTCIFFVNTWTLTRTGRKGRFDLQASGNFVWNALLSAGLWDSWVVRT